MAFILAIDSGLTVTKAVIFDARGRTTGIARRNVPQLMPCPHHVERDMGELWRLTAEAIREALAVSGCAARDIAAVAATAHGDGVYLLDREECELGAGILSLDSRAAGVVADWARDGVDAKSLALTGQAPYLASHSALLAWIRDRDPDRYARIGHVLACKDYLRWRLTGTIGTDRTEASTSFTDVRTQRYSGDALTLFGLESIAHALPPVSAPDGIVGSVTARAAEATGLVEGTPVAAGLHDVTASTLGVGAHRTGVIGIVAGTYSINEAVSTAPRCDPAWLCRNAIEAGVWNNMAISPASTTNYEWFLNTFCRAEQDRAAARGASIHDVLAPEIDAALARASSVVYHPFLFGSPFGPQASSGFFGLRGWHERGDVLAALLEGIAFNHRHHVDALRTAFPAEAAILTGGASRNPTVARLFADVLGLPVTVTQTDESAAWGAALCAGAAVGLFDRFDADPRDLGAISTTWQPDPGRRAHYAGRYDVYRDLAKAMSQRWTDLETLAERPRGGRE